MSVLPLHDRPEVITEAQTTPHCDAGAEASATEKPERCVFQRPTSRPKRLDKTRAVATVLAVSACASALALTHVVPDTGGVFTIAPSNFRPELSSLGVVDAAVWANVVLTFHGDVTALLVDRTDAVAKGNLIAEIGATDLKAEHVVTFASHQATRYAMEATAADVTRMQASIENARQTLARQSKLPRSGADMQSGYEGRKTEVRQAEVHLIKVGSTLLQAEALTPAAAGAVQPIAEICLPNAGGDACGMAPIGGCDA